MSAVMELTTTPDDAPEADAYWLVLLGDGTWGYGDYDRRMVSFTAGVHRVDEVAAEFALRAESPVLLVLDYEPTADEVAGWNADAARASGRKSLAAPPMLHESPPVYALRDPQNPGRTLRVGAASLAEFEADGWVRAGSSG